MRLRTMAKDGEDGLDIPSPGIVDPVQLQSSTDDDS